MISGDEPVSSGNCYSVEGYDTSDFGYPSMYLQRYL
jgi:hypothetical protein